MAGHPQRFWLAALITAWSVDFLFWAKPVGISLVVFVALILSGGIFLARSERVRPVWSFILLAFFALLTAGAAIFRTEPLTRFLNSMLALGLLVVSAMTFRVENWPQFDLMDDLIAVLVLIGDAITRAARLPLFPKGKDEEGKQVAVGRVLGKSAPLLRGLLLALPVVLVFGWLLAQADPIFNDSLNSIWKVFDVQRLPEYLFRITYVLILAYLFAGIYLHAIFPKETQLKRPLSKGFPRFIGFTEAAVVLTCVDLLFALFVAIQFRYLFGGQANITSAGYTYSDYARRGFFELVAVAVLSLALSFSLGSLTKREARGQQRAYTTLSVLLVGLVWVILASAFMRLALYEDAYGFTRLRAYTHIFIPWLGLILLAVIVLQVLKRERMFGAVLLAAVVGFSLTFGAVNVDGFIASQNIARAKRGADLDANTLANLSEDALPEIIQAYTAPGTPAPVKEKLGAVLACRVFRLKTGTPVSWQGYHPGMAADLAGLQGLNFSNYTVQYDSKQPFIKAGSETLYCLSSQFLD